MAMPTRDGVWLQRRKSARAGVSAPIRKIATTVAASKVGGIRRAIRISRIASVTIDQDCTKVVYIGESRAWGHQVAQPGEECGRVVVVKKGGGIEADGPGTPDGCWIDIGSGRVIGLAGTPVGPVGVCGERRDPGGASQRRRQGKGILLVGPATTVASDGHG